MQRVGCNEFNDYDVCDVCDVRNVCTVGTEKIISKRLDITEIMAFSLRSLSSFLMFISSKSLMVPSCANNTGATSSAQSSADTISDFADDTKTGCEYK